MLGSDKIGKLITITRIIRNLIKYSEKYLINLVVAWSIIYIRYKLGVSGRWHIRLIKWRGIKKEKNLEYITFRRMQIKIRRIRHSIYITNIEKILEFEIKFLLII